MQNNSSISSCKLLVAAFACIAFVGCGGGGGGGDEGGDGGGEGGGGGGGQPAFLHGCDGAASLGGAYMVEVVANFDVPGDFTLPFLPIAGHFEGGVLQLVPMEEIIDTDCDDLDEGACGTNYGLTLPGLDTASPSGFHSSMRVMALSNTHASYVPVLAGLTGVYHHEGDDLTVMALHVALDAASTDLLEFTFQYLVVSGDVVAAIRVDTEGADDDCDGLVDEADEVRFEDGTDVEGEASGMVVGDGVLVLKLRR